MDLTREHWPKGWRPSDDLTHGDPQGLLRMDNLCLDEDNVLSLVRGIDKINSSAFDGVVHSCYSKYVSNTKWRYAGLSSGKVLRGKGNDWAEETEVVGPTDGPLGSDVRTHFGSMLGAVLIFSGAARKRDVWDDTTSQLVTYNITPETPTEKLSDINFYQPRNSLTDSRWNASYWTLNLGANGTLGDDYYQFDTVIAPGTGGYHAKVTLTFAPDGHQSMIVGGSENIETDDAFYFAVRIGDTTKLERVRVEFVLGTDITTPEEYYWKEWNNYEDSPFNQGEDVWTTLKAKRSEFTREGSNGDFNWTTVWSVKFYFRTRSTVVNNIVTDARWVGGNDGEYEYIQVNVSNTGSWLAKSEKGPISDKIEIRNGYVTIDPIIPTDSSVNEIWIYRRSAAYKVVDSIAIDAVPKLDQWYRVALIKISGGTFTPINEETRDIQALADNVTYNNNLTSVLDYPDDIFGVVTNYYGRAIYITFKEVLISDNLDPGLIDNSKTIKLSGDPTSVNLWISPSRDGLLYIGTSYEIFAVSGSLGTNPDGTLDATVTPLNVNYPPLCHDACAHNGIIYYVASDGVRAISGDATSLISPQLNLLFQGHIRYYISPVHVLVNDAEIYDLTIAKSKLWVTIKLKDGTRRLFVYDILKQYWYPYYTDPISLFTEEDDILIAGYGGGSGNYLRELDIGDLLDGVIGQDIYLQTIADDNEQPRNRKDFFTFKIVADTGNVAINISLAKNGGTQYYTIGSTAFDGKTEKLITIAETIGLGKSISVMLTGSGLRTFKLYQLTEEYDPRPEQLTYLRIPFTNLQTTSRKRFVNYAFTIDTLGEDCEFFPLIDGAIAGNSSILNFNYKGTHIHYFIQERVGTDIGGIICGFFEFYHVNLDEIVSEKLPVPVKYLIIPPDDYGVPNRKRHSSYKFQILTRGYNVRFTPIIDSVSKAPVIYNTNVKETVEYFFSQDTIGIDVGGILETLVGQPFEFYGRIVPQHIEVLPPRLKEFRVPENNYGVAAEKRVRTMPMVINTNGYDVTFTPIVDHVSGTSTTINTSSRQTAYHFFTTDVFGVDFSGELIGIEPFEFYGLEKPEDVEVLPVPKKFDQFGPIQFDRIGKIVRLRLRVITKGTSISYKILSELEATLPDSDSAVGDFTGTFDTVANVDNVYEAIVPKTVVGTVFRVELGPTTEAFHRYTLEVQVKLSGMETDARWIKIK